MTTFIFASKVMEHRLENCPISVKKWWLLRNALENRGLDSENERNALINKSFDNYAKIDALKSNSTKQTSPVNRISSQVDLPVYQDAVHRRTTPNSQELLEINSKCIDKSIMPKELKYSNSNIFQGKCTEILSPQRGLEMELYTNQGLRHFSSNLNETRNECSAISQLNPGTARPVAVPNVYSSKESSSRDIPPLIGFFRYYDFRNACFLQYNDNSHSDYGTDEIKYHLTRNNEKIFYKDSTVKLQTVNCNERNVNVFQGPYPNNLFRHDYYHLVDLPNGDSKLREMEWPLIKHYRESSRFSKDILVEHLAEDPIERPHACPDCGKAFVQKRYLLNHLSVHSGERRYLCEICHKNFSHKSNLVKHLKVHSGERPYSCDICDKRFVQKIHLVNHMTVHSGERPYPCHICQKRFSYKSNLVKHIKLHSGKKPFACNVCDKRFTQKVNLTMHQKLHEKGPFACSICQKKFLYESSVAKHIIAHNGEKPYCCSICDKKFIQKANLAKHIKVHKPSTLHS